jgi:hypothetical protein
VRRRGKVVRIEGRWREVATGRYCDRRHEKRRSLRCRRSGCSCSDICRTKWPRYSEVVRSIMEWYWVVLEGESDFGGW